MAKARAPDGVRERRTLHAFLDCRARARERFGVDVEVAVHQRPESRHVIQRRNDLARLGERLGDAGAVQLARKVLEQAADVHRIAESFGGHSSPSLSATSASRSAWIS